MKKIINISAWILFLIGVFMILSFCENKKDITVCDHVKVMIDSGSGNLFVTEDIVKDVIKSSGYVVGETEMDAIETKSIETKLLDITSVETVSVFKEVNGTLKVELKQRVPVVRIFNKDGTSMYIDDKGKIMPTASNYTARVVVVNGEFNEKDIYEINEIKMNDSLAQLSHLDEVYDFVNYFRKDEFLLAQFEQIYREKNGDYLVIPKVGNQKINFGKLDGFEEKIQKLKTFYKDGINPENLNLYTEINLKYNGQIVCTKK